MRGANSMSKIRTRFKQKELSAEYYNANIGQHEMVEPEDSNWRGVYDLALGFLPPANNYPTIMDIGCGTGMFARLLFKKGYSNYMGFDVAKKRVDIAKQAVPTFDFFVRNVYDEEYLKPLFKNFEYFVSLEVLEHLEKDREIIAMIPKGRKIIFSVPNYWTPSHVRAFANRGMIKERFKDMLEFLQIQTFTGSKTRHRDAYGVSRNYHSKLFVCKCIKRI
jgi:2-polyprenyl-3-methyl-5-hydroxy-6-metoxy-1,4-benzoquinol methylase